MIGLFLGVIFILVGWFYIDSKKKHQYWKTRGVPFENPLTFLGSSLKMLLMMESQGEMLRNVYNLNKDKKYVGIYEFNKPILIPIDNELIGKILVKDFSNFVDHGVMEEEPETEVDAILFSLRGSKWRALRYRMSPVFSTGKLRGMFPEMIKCSRSLVSHLEEIQDTDIDMNLVAKGFSMSIIASCAFGLEISMDDDSEFMKMGKEINRMTIKRYCQMLVKYIFPGLGKWLGITFTPRHVAEYFAGIIKETFSYRLKNNVVRNDFVQMLLEIKQKGSVELPHVKDNDEDKYLNIDSPPPTEKIELTDDILISQAYSFIQAGFDGLTLTVMFTLFELGQNQEMQERAREEIRNAIRKHGDLTFDALKEATFLHNCVKEGLRKYPLSPVIYRQCTKKYWLEDGIAIEPGTGVFISVLGLHNDPQHFPEPQEFLPDRFLQEPNPYTNISFGDGPRMCIAMRFSQLVIKLACAIVLNNFNIQLSPKTELPIKMDVKSFFPTPSTPILFKLTKINT